MNRVLTEQRLKKLNRTVLSHIEIELGVLKETLPNASRDIDNMFTRLRKNVLDAIGDCKRSILDEE